MNDTADQQRADQIAERAADWFVRVGAEDATEADWAGLSAWLAQSPDHAEAYDRLERIALDLDDDIAAVPDLASGAGLPEGVASLRPRASRALALRYWVPAAMAASLALAAVGLFPFLAPPPTQAYATATGQSRLVTLDDGTRIHLNTASSLKVSYGRRARRVEMIDGEAIFDVTHDPARPFVIAVGDREVEVVGTEFDIYKSGSAATVTVRRGVVAVRPADGGETIRLVRGQQLIHPAGGAASIVRTVDPEEVFAWRTRHVVYRDRPLGEVAADLSRYFTTPIRTRDADVGAIRFSGVLVVDSEESVVRRLQVLLPVQAERSAQAIVLRRADPQPR